MTTQPADIPMGQCTITGKVVPEDELVTFQGQRVCAEGKAILLDRLKAGETMPGEVERPTFWRRFGCYLLDGVVIFVPLAIINAIVLAMAGPSPMLTGVLSIICTTLELFYFGQMHAARGQTVGKIAGGLRVVNMDGSPISAGTAYLRAIAFIGPGYLSGIAYIIATPIITIVLGVIVFVYLLTNCLFLVFDTNTQRALHDRIAGTRVIKLPS